MARAAALVAVLTAVLAACGGSDDGPTREDFAAEANRICREGEAKVAGIVEEMQAQGGNADPEQAAADALERATEEYEPIMERLRRVEAPDDLEDDWKAFLDEIQEAFDLFPRLADATRSGDRDELSELTTRFAQIAGDTRPFAQRHDLDDCLPENGQL
jgi:hypothetical protein